MVLLRAFADNIIARLMFFVNKKRYTRYKENEGAKSTPSGGALAPSKQPAGLRPLEAQREFRPPQTFEKV